MSKIEVLMSAMHQTDMSIAKRSNVQTDTLIINQCDRDGYDEEIYNGHKIRMISTTERGVSKSRNMAVDNANGDICIMADDDEVFSDGYAEAIKEAYAEKPDADIIAFNVQHTNPRHKRKTIQSFKKSPKSQTYGTWSLTFRRNSVTKKNVRFNELFGPGSGVIASGEDSVWLKDAIKNKLKVYQHPFCIVEVSQADSTWFKGYDESYFYNRGAYLYQVMPGTCRLIKYYYILRLQGVSKLSVAEQIKWMNKGINGFAKGLSYDEYIKGIQE